MMKYNHWTVLDDTTKMWLVRCVCGFERRSPKFDIVNGKSKSCGCATRAERIEKQRKSVVKHGLSDSPTHRSWVEMRRRCYASHRKEYQNYGGRGINVCDRWKDSFDNFLSDMGIRPDGYTLDRIDNNGDYAPENCRWIPRSHQEWNKRTNRIVNMNGDSIPLSEAIRRKGMNKATVYNRVCTLGWDIDRALEEPVHKR